MAVKFEWNEIYELGISEIDLQHKKLISISNELYDIATSNDASYKISMSKILKGLTDYTVYHFTSEEEFMKKYGYEGTPMHKLAHDNFIAEVTQQIKKLSDASQDDILVFYDYIANWILAHIAKADKVWASFVKPKL